MAFTLISISRLTKARFSMTFVKGMCTIKNPKGQTIATIPNSDGLSKIAAERSINVSETANMASEKMFISKAHRKMGHIAHSAISNKLIVGINLDNESKFDFCNACAKAKLVHQMHSLGPMGTCYH